jgi:hypothetical protein
MKLSSPMQERGISRRWCMIFTPLLIEILWAHAFVRGQHLAAFGDRSPLSQGEHLETGFGAKDLSLSAAQAGDHQAQPSLGDGHHLHPDGPRVHLTGRRGGLVHTACPGMAGRGAEPPALGRLTRHHWRHGPARSAVGTAASAARPSIIRAKMPLSLHRFQRL